eukprot:GHUV01020240.1.p2 GENE.GHUV01020240.1~~GHUV01020240.1.p2  ORF type:complete len:113 (+),score=3.86 GHUV01020240.1:1117-1455(+)
MLTFKAIRLFWWNSFPLIHGSPPRTPRPAACRTSGTDWQLQQGQSNQTHHSSGGRMLAGTSIPGLFYTFSPLLSAGRMGAKPLAIRSLLVIHAFFMLGCKHVLHFPHFGVMP